MPYLTPTEVRERISVGGPRLDVSKFQLLEKSGKPVPIPSGAPRRVAYTYGVTQDAKTLKWYVTTEKATGTC